MNALDMAGHLIRRLHQQATLIFTQRTQAAGLDLTPVQFAALDVLATHPGLDQSSLAGWIAYDRATLGGVIERLEQKGWVQRVVKPRDRRARELSLTEAGARVHASAQPLVRALQDEILQPLAPPERECFVRLAQRIVWPTAAVDAPEVPDTPDEPDAPDELLADPGTKRCADRVRAAAGQAAQNAALTPPSA